MESCLKVYEVIVKARSSPLVIGGETLVFSYSKSQTIRKYEPSEEEDSATSTSHILLITIRNPVFCITADVIHSVTSTYGTVVRIVVFNKNNTPQALVEFENATVASEAKKGLHGKDLYPQGCTLQIIYSKTTKLRVTTNSDTQRDYTNTTLPEKILFSGFTPASDFCAVYPVVDTPTKCVLVVRGFLPHIMTPERIFNLVCIYGNVAKIKCVPNSNCTLIQMSNNSGADQVLQKLHKVKLFGETLHVEYSNLSFIAEPSHTESGNTESKHTFNFISSRLNKFRRNSKHKSGCFPTKTLYFSNTPKNWNKELVKDLFTRLQVRHAPTKIKFLAKKREDNDGSKHSKMGHRYNKKDNKNNVGSDNSSHDNTKPNQNNTNANDSDDNSSHTSNNDSNTSNDISGVEKEETTRGLLEFSSISTATAAIVFLNNEKIGNNFMRLSFSNLRI